MRCRYCSATGQASTRKSNEIKKVVAFLELRNAVEDVQIRKPQVKMLGHHYSGPEVWLFLELALRLLAGRPPDKESVHGYELF